MDRKGTVKHSRRTTKVARSRVGIERKYENEKIQIMYAVAKFLARNIYTTFTLDAVAATIGNTKGKFYYYFKSKSDLLYEMQMYVFDMAEEAIFKSIDGKDLTPRERVETLIRAFLNVVFTNCELWRALWELMTWRELAAPLHKSLVRRRLGVEHNIEAVIEELVNLEGWAGYDSKLTARTIMATVNSVSRWYRSNGRLSAEVVADSIVKFIFEGYFPQSASKHIPEGMASKK